MAYTHKGAGSDVFVHADPDGIKCVNCCCRFPERADVICKTAAEMLAHLEDHRSRGHAVPDAAMDRLALEAGVKRPKRGRPPLDAAMLHVLAGVMITMESARERYVGEGRRLALLVVENVNPKPSELERQAVEDAHDVLSHFNQDGSLQADADNATVLASIATLKDQVQELLTPREIAILRQASEPKPTLAETVALALRSVRGVEGAFLSGKTIYVVAREHGMVDREAVIQLEEMLVPWDIEIHVRAHQGRDIESLGLGSRIV